MHYATGSDAEMDLYVTKYIYAWLKTSLAIYEHAVQYLDYGQKSPPAVFRHKLFYSLAKFSSIDFINLFGTNYRWDSRFINLIPRYLVNSTIMIFWKVSLANFIWFLLPNFSMCITLWHQRQHNSQQSEFSFFAFFFQTTEASSGGGRTTLT